MYTKDCVNLLFPPSLLLQFFDTPYMTVVVKACFWKFSSCDSACGPVEQGFSHNHYTVSWSPGVRAPLQRTFWHFWLRHSALIALLTPGILRSYLGEYHDINTDKWRTLTRVKLNRLYALVGRFNADMWSWGLSKSPACDCGADQQTANESITKCPYYSLLKQNKTKQNKTKQNKKQTLSKNK